ncbi:hypothetical protein EXIGLDRAFT_768518 [Exidia glandulosa HHB12029]|uniref:DUF6532 domain-containing protein n=1 Tax=Exidia glandulosa HHB12029 TaxID=1314781 RepID=A0A165I709_EXIGL|nr:hypothetical protein EXIGLDRAFT_782585 [Exidia glandulosa HHB12029]KZV92990.1 hypothetical protein EXIGLDRAFT_768518 [Exidia glandulosa HHB12029]
MEVVRVKQRKQRDPRRKLSSSKHKSGSTQARQKENDEFDQLANKRRRKTSSANGTSSTAATGTKRKRPITSSSSPRDSDADKDQDGHDSDNHGTNLQDDEEDFISQEMRERAEDPEGTSAFILSSWGNEGETDEELERTREHGANKRVRLMPQITVSSTLPLNRAHNGRRTTAQDRTTPEPSVPEIPCTPYHHVPHPSKRYETREQDFTPPSRGMLKYVKPRWHVFVITVNGFPAEDTDAAAFLKPEIKAALKLGDAGEKGRIGRVGDSQYMRVMMRNVFVVASNVRSHILKIARPMVETHYELRHKAGENINQRMERVKRLMLNFAFTAVDDVNGTGLFERSIVHELLTRAFFNSPDPQFNLGADEEFVDNFKTWSDPMIALSTVVIYHCLSEWQAGIFEKQTFNERNHKLRYGQALKNLRMLTTGGAVEEIFNRKRASWYREAWGVTSLSSSTVDGPSLEASILRSRALLMQSASQSVEQDGSA